ncbi:MAG: C25 family cysteine peptidase [Promethearchaeota archaeon]
MNTKSRRPAKSRRSLTPAWGKLAALLLVVGTLGALVVGLAWVRVSQQVPTPASPIPPSAGAEDFPRRYWEVPWYSTRYDCVIVAADSFVDLLEDYAGNKTNRGVRTKVLPMATILANASWKGRDDAESVHNALRDYYEWYHIEYVILGGATTLVPIRYVYNPDTQELGEHEVVGEQNIKPTDYYYADLVGSDWDEDGDGYWGESPKHNEHGVDEIDWTPEVAVGRLPASTTAEMEALLSKLHHYEYNPTAGDWVNKVLLAGAISDTPSEAPPDGEDEAWLTNYINDNYVDSRMQALNLYESTSGYTPDPSADYLSKTSFGNAFKAGASITIFAGHGTTNKISQKSPFFQDLFTASDLDTYLNTGKPTFFYASACTTSPYDVYTTTALGRTLILKDNAGAIGFIGALRLSWYFEEDTNLEMLNRGMAKLFWKNFFVGHLQQPGKTLNAMRVEYLNSSYFRDNSWANTSVEYDRKNVLTYNLLGDPEVPVRTRSPGNYSVEVEDRDPSRPGIQVYEGQLVRLTLDDGDGGIPYYSTALFRGQDGAYYSATNNASNVVEARLPLNPEGTNQNYTVTLTGPDMNAYQFTIEALEDDRPPVCSMEGSEIPELGTIDVPLEYALNASDGESGLEYVRLNVSDDGGAMWSSYDMTPGNDSLYHVTLPLLPDGTYLVEFGLGDFAGNEVVVDNDQQDFRTLIPTPTLKYAVLIAAVGGLLGLAAVGTLSTVNGWRELSTAIDREGGREVEHGK